METRCGDACLKSCAESAHFLEQKTIMVGAGFTGSKTGHFCRLLLTQHVCP